MIIGCLDILFCKVTIQIFVYLILMVFLPFKNVFMGVICILDTSTLFGTKVSKSDPTRVCRNYNQ